MASKQNKNVNDSLSKKIDILLENTADLSLKRKARQILLDLDPKEHEKILDVGCGDGYYILLTNQLGNFYSVGLEYDQNNLVAAERNFNNLGIRYKRVEKWQKGAKKGTYLIQGDVNKMPFESNFFDKVIMSEVAEHLPDDRSGLKEVYRCIKKGGVLLLTVPNHNYPFLWDPVNWTLERFLNFHFKSGFLAGIWNQHVRLYYPQEIEAVIKKAGFKIIKKDVQTRWSLPFSHYLINLGARMLAAKVLPKNISSQVNKFEKFDPQKRSGLIKLYFNLAKFADDFNKKNNSNVGTTIYILAQK